MSDVNVSSHPHNNLSVGIDLESISRFEPGESPLISPNENRVFTPEEHDHCQAVAHPAACYAVHWCAKEAGVKALWPWIHLDPRRLCLHHEKSGRYSLLVDGGPPDGLGITVSTSVSYSGMTAVAVVVASSASARGPEWHQFAE